MNITASSAAATPSPAAQPAIVSSARRLLWTVQRELWENRSIYVAPLAVAALIIVASVIGTFGLPGRLHATVMDLSQQHKIVEEPFMFAALLLMFIAMVIGVIYCLDALYGERRDRSVLFWKSLPVSDGIAVTAKASIPLLVLPLLTFAVTVVTQMVMLLISSLRLMGTGISIWSHLSFPQMWLILLYHLIVVHALWWAPFWAWLLLVSAWARRAPFLWAVLPLLTIGLIEKIAFNTSYFASFLAYRFLGGPGNGATGSNPMSMASLTPTPLEFLTSISFWMGLAVAVLFLAAAVRLRRSQQPL